MKLKQMREKIKLLIGAAIGVLSIIFLITAIVLFNNKLALERNLRSVQAENREIEQSYNDLRNVDQYKRNEELDKNIKQIEEAYDAAAKTYEAILEIEDKSKKTNEFKEAYAEVIFFLSEQNYASATARLENLNNEIKKEQTIVAAANVPSIPQNVEINNTPPGSGYSRQYVKTDFGTFMVDIITADLNSTRVIVDTASEGTCTNDCPVNSIGNYAAQNGAWAAINGPYFCPADYPSCADKKNSFDTLLMNKSKVYFNSDNNVYSTVPAVIFSGSSARFVSQSLQWGRDTGVDSVIASQPLLVFDGNVVFGGDDEVKRSGQGSRSFIGSSGNTAYIGVVHNVNAAQMARVLHTMGIKNALNLDSGGSTALWTNGRYVVGPGRNLPFGILFVHK